MSVGSQPGLKVTVSRVSRGRLRLLPGDKHSRRLLREEQQTHGFIKLPEFVESLLYFSQNGFNVRVHLLTVSAQNSFFLTSDNRIIECED